MASRRLPPKITSTEASLALLPHTQRLGLTTRRLLGNLLGLAASDPELRQPASPTPLFSARLSTVLVATGMPVPVMALVQRHLVPLRLLQLVWQGTQTDAQMPPWHHLPLLAQASLTWTDDAAWLHWAHPPAVLAALRDPRHWARADLDLLIRLGSHSAQALYRLCADHRHAASGSTPSQPLPWWVDALSPMPAGRSRRVWRQFKNERVLEAIDEINRGTDLAIRLVEQRQGRTVVQARFAVASQAAPGPLWASGPSGPVDAGLVWRAEAQGLAEDRLDALLGEFGDAAVAAQLQVVEARSAAGQLPSGRLRAATLRALLRQAADGPVVAAVDASVGGAAGGSAGP